MIDSKKPTILLVDQSILCERETIGMKILLVEDHKMVQVFTKSLINDEHPHYQVDTADDGESAWEMLGAPYDLILMDIGLPGIDGFQLTKKIRAESRANAHTKVVALTAHADKECQRKSIEYDLDGLIAKPLTKVKFQQLLQQFGLL